MTEQGFSLEGDFVIASPDTVTAAVDEALLILAELREIGAVQELDPGVEAAKASWLEQLPAARLHITEALAAVSVQADIQAPEEPAPQRTPPRVPLRDEMDMPVTIRRSERVAPEPELAPEPAAEPVEQPAAVDEPEARAFDQEVVIDVPRGLATETGADADSRALSLAPEEELAVDRNPASPAAQVAGPPPATDIDQSDTEQAADAEPQEDPYAEFLDGQWHFQGHRITKDLWVKNNRLILVVGGNEQDLSGKRDVIASVKLLVEQGPLNEDELVKTLAQRYHGIVNLETKGKGKKIIHEIDKAFHNHGGTTVDTVHADGRTLERIAVNKKAAPIDKHLTVLEDLLFFGDDAIDASPLAVQLLEIFRTHRRTLDFDRLLGIVQADNDEVGSGEIQQALAEISGKTGILARIGLLPGWIVELEQRGKQTIRKVGIMPVLFQEAAEAA
jgi:hypothetical protein